MTDRFLASEQALADLRTSVLLGAIDWRDALLDSGGHRARGLLPGAAAPLPAGVRRQPRRAGAQRRPARRVGLARGAHPRGERLLGLGPSPRHAASGAAGHRPAAPSRRADQPAPRERVPDRRARAGAQPVAPGAAAATGDRGVRAVAQPVPGDRRRRAAVEPRRRRVRVGAREPARAHPPGAAGGQRGERRPAASPVRPPRARPGGRAARDRPRTARRSRPGADGRQDAAGAGAPVGAGRPGARHRRGARRSRIPPSSPRGRSRGCCTRRCSKTPAWPRRSTGF